MLSSTQACVIQLQLLARWLGKCPLSTPDGPFRVTLARIRRHSFLESISGSVRVARPPLRKGSGMLGKSESRKTNWKINWEIDCPLKIYRKSAFRKSIFRFSMSGPAARWRHQPGACRSCTGVAFGNTAPLLAAAGARFPHMALRLSRREWRAARVAPSPVRAHGQVFREHSWGVLGKSENRKIDWKINWNMDFP